MRCAADGRTADHIWRRCEQTATQPSFCRASQDADHSVATVVAPFRGRPTKCRLALRRVALYHEAAPHKRASYQPSRRGHLCDHYATRAGWCGVVATRSLSWSTCLPIARRAHSCVRLVRVDVPTVAVVTSRLTIKRHAWMWQPQACVGAPHRHRLALVKALKLSGN